MKKNFKKVKKFFAKRTETFPLWPLQCHQQTHFNKFWNNT